jgi:hypothetical protein
MNFGCFLEFRIENGIEIRKKGNGPKVVAARFRNGLFGLGTVWANDSHAAHARWQARAAVRARHRRRGEVRAAPATGRGWLTADVGGREGGSPARLGGAPTRKEGGRGGVGWRNGAARRAPTGGEWRGLGRRWPAAPAPMEGGGSFTRRTSSSPSMGTAARSPATEAEGGAARELQQRQWCRRCRSEPAGKEDDGEETDGGSGEEAKWQRGAKLTEARMSRLRTTPSALGHFIPRGLSDVTATAPLSQREETASRHLH